MFQTCVRRTAARAFVFSSRRRALTLPEVLVMAGATLLLLALVAVVATRHPRRSGWSPRTACAANLSGMGKGLYTYAVENNDMFPIAAHAPAEADEVGRVKYAPGMIGTHRGVAGDPNSGETTEADTEMSTTRHLWVLVRTGGTSPRSFICPSTPDKANDEDNPADFRDFRSWEEVSYGYQIPYGKHGRPSSMCDQRMPLAADKGPYGAAMESGIAPSNLPRGGVTLDTTRIALQARSPCDRWRNQASSQGWMSRDTETFR